MTDYIASALSSQQILVSNALATVASECIVLRTSTGSSQAVLSLSEIRHISVIRLSHPGLLVLALAAFLIAAGAHSSKDGDAAEWPIALIGVLLVISFLGSRRAAVCFRSDDATIQTVFGSSSAAYAVVEAARSAMEKLRQDSESEPLAS